MMKSTAPDYIPLFPIISRHCLTFSLIPIPSGWLSDNETLERLARRPQTAIDALYLGQKDLVLGLATALAGEGLLCGTFKWTACSPDSAEGRSPRDLFVFTPWPRISDLCSSPGPVSFYFPSGIVLDPYEGSRAPGHMAVVGAVAGFFKAMAGLMLRPSIGILEATSKLLQGAGLACTGKRGIQVRHPKGWRQE